MTTKPVRKSIMLAAIVPLLICFCISCHKRVAATTITDPIHLYQYLAGGQSRRSEVKQGSGIYDELSTYLMLCEDIGGSSSMDSFAPSLVVSTDKIKVNIQRNIVVLSTRRDVDAVWNQVVRSRDTKDNQIESAILAYLDSTSE